MGIPGVSGITITLTLVNPKALEGFPQSGTMTTVTGADGSYSFPVPNVPAMYRLTESVDKKSGSCTVPCGRRHRRGRARHDGQ